jgi:hypothetical protein
VASLSIFYGSVTGSNLELREGKLIVQRWRFGSWTDGDQSQVCGFASHFRDCVQGYNINSSISCCCYY